MKAFIDTETAGLHGVAVIIQYAYDDGPIMIHNFWTSSIDQSLALIEKLCTCEVVGFNLAFDWFHIQKIHTLLTLAKERGFEIPEHHIKEIAALEERARDGACVKPFKALDLMLHARKTEFQITMNRGDIRIRRVPTQIAWQLAKELESRIKFDSILFAKRKSRLAKWVVHDIKTLEGSVNPDFKDIVLKFKPSVALKALAVHVLKIPPEEVISFQDVEVSRFYWPAEVGWAPFAAAVGRLSKKDQKKFKGRKTWPHVLEYHIGHWNSNALAREYASKDVKFTRLLYEYFQCPEAGDDDSELACMVGSVRWRGYAIDIPGIQLLRTAAVKKIQETPTSPNMVKRWIGEVMSETERRMFTSTGKIVLEKMAAKAHGETCMFGPCEHCKDGWLPGPESAKRAAEVLEVRKMKKEVELYDKLLVAGRFHASFKVIGALSSRMSGTDGLNPQGIKKTKDVRSKFPFAFGGLKLWGGDFAGFEVVLAEAAYHDPALRKDLLTCENCRDVQVTQLKTTVKANAWLSADALKRFIEIQLQVEAKKKKKDANYVMKSPEQLAQSLLHTFACPKCGCNSRMKIHALFGIFVYPGMTYDEIKATDGTENDIYTRCKSAVFAMIYGGEGYTLMTRLGVDIEVANEAYKKFTHRYPGVGLARKRVFDAFCSIRQVGGLGSRIVYNTPSDFVESLLGFRRYFTLENKIVKALFELAEAPPKEWRDLKIKVHRRDRDQTVGGATQSALFGTTFQVQAGNMRAAANHEIQSSGAGITKHVQRKIWDVQPAGIHQWLVQPMNVHDQVLTATHPDVIEQVNKIVYDAVESFRDRVPLIEFDYHEMQNWGSK